jgi:2-oxoglutarate dehydrogenase complex dihydrolipoamide succinyltransferase (E2) component
VEIMAFEFKMPQLGESVVEGTVGRWLKQVGNRVQEFEPLLEVVTDKVETEVPSPVDGVLLEIRVAEGETVAVASVLALIGEADETPAEARKEPPSAAEAMPPAAEKTPEERPQGRGYLTPVVAKMAAEHNVDLSRVAGTGRHGRITKKDMVQHLEEREAAAPMRERPTKPAAPTPAPALKAARAAAPGDREVPLTRMRQTIARHMRQAKDTAAHVTTFMEVDMSRVIAFRQAHKAEFEAEGINLTFTPFFVQAIVAGLKAYPMLNATFDQDKLTYKRAIHVGMAVDLGEEGLIVPVIRDADELSLRGLSRAVTDLATRARDGKLQPDDVLGGTFSLTNHGTIGSLFATPIIPMPQVGILGVGLIQKRPVVVETDLGDTIAIRPMMYLSLSFDHRVIDGATADRFLGTVKATLESYGA